MRSPLCYFGGKSKLAKTIVSMIPQDHTCYVEPLAGAAWVLFEKRRSETEIINDLDLELITFWRVLQNHLEEFLRYYKWAVVSRHLFDLANKQDPTLLTDVQRAVRYYYLQRLSFGGRASGRTFGTATSGGPRLNLETMEDVLLEVHWRLEGTVIEHLDACECVMRYDRRTTVFYLDPPYYGTGQAYAHKYAEADFERLASTLGGVVGRFILSINDHPDVRRMFASFHVKGVDLRYSAGNPRQSTSTRSKLRSKLLITNFKPTARR